MSAIVLRGFVATPAGPTTYRHAAGSSVDAAMGDQTRTPRRRRGLLMAGGATAVTASVVLSFWLFAPTDPHTRATGTPTTASPSSTATTESVSTSPLAPVAMAAATSVAAAATAPSGPTSAGAHAPSAAMPPAEESVLPPPPKTPWPSPLTGRVVDQEGAPVERASIVIAGAEHVTNADGVFTVDSAPAGAPLLVKSPGFERITLEPTPSPIEVVLRPHVVKAAYLTYFGIADRVIRTRVLDLVARSELNAVVIDVKGDRGWIPYRTEVPLALAAGAQGPVILKDLEGMLADFKGRGIYAIARIVVFKDNVLASHRPDWAIIDTRTGRPWIDNEKLAWVDPFREEVWSYNIAIAKEAARKGFDEVQFDYVRFPTDGKLAAARYARPNTKETRLPTIASFLERARREIGPTGAFVAADVFGYTAFNENDTDIGQRVEELAPHLDYICPMVYPSGYTFGIPGTRNPVANPYQIVYESVRLTRKRAAHANVRVRPWLQDFRDYAFDRRVFGVTELRAQMRGAEAGGAAGFMLWNPKNDYTGAALGAKGSLAAK